jgi:transposase
LHERLARNVFASDHHFADDTPVPVLDPGRGAPRRDGCGSMPASNARVAGRSRRPPSICSRRTANLNVRSRISSGLSGVLHVDGYAGFEPLAEKGDAVELAWYDPLPARRPHRAGHEPRRARDSTRCFLEGRIISLRAATRGSRWTVLCSLIETCKLNGVEPYAYLKDVLERMVDGYPSNRLDELLPWAWRAEDHVKP